MLDNQALATCCKGFSDTILFRVLPCGSVANILTTRLPLLERQQIRHQVFDLLRRQLRGIIAIHAAQPVLWVAKVIAWDNVGIRVRNRLAQVFFYGLCFTSIRLRLYNFSRIGRNVPQVRTKVSAGEWLGLIVACQAIGLLRCE